ncbi:hypothetical protein BJ742DRAFT_744334 [Cladochytrium replicatum]|nr:hypothetical protein BJ742DRAFT_744334 [Cladochytrium replicatum]
MVVAVASVVALVTATVADVEATVMGEADVVTTVRGAADVVLTVGAVTVPKNLMMTKANLMRKAKSPGKSSSSKILLTCLRSPKHQLEAKPSVSSRHYCLRQKRTIFL